MHVTELLIRDKKSGELMDTHHTQNRHEGVQGRSDDPDEASCCRRVDGKRTKGAITKGLRLTVRQPLEYAQVPRKLSRAYVGIPG